MVFETDLDNELELTLDVNEDYFRDVKSISELKTAISNAFISKQYRTYDFESVIEDLGDISSYEWLMEKLDECGMEDISGIILMTNTDGDTRVYRWYKYALSPYSCTSGSFERESKAIHNLCRRIFNTPAFVSCVAEDHRVQGNWDGKALNQPRAGNGHNPEYTWLKPGFPWTQRISLHRQFILSPSRMRRQKETRSWCSADGQCWRRGWRRYETDVCNPW